MLFFGTGDIASQASGKFDHTFADRGPKLLYKERFSLRSYGGNCDNAGDARPIREFPIADFHELHMFAGIEKFLPASSF